MAIVTIAIDAMGGDHGPEVTIPASLQALQRHPQLRLILVGNSDVINTILQTHHAVLSDRLQIRHATQTIAMDESPSQALRTKKDSSMRVAVDLVKAGNAQACVSAGNTGALMATARFVLKTLPGIDRPAIMACLPTYNPQREVRVLDLGANVDSSADSLYQFAVMGSIVASAIDNISRPKVALLNIGEEEIKGNEIVKQTSQLLSENSSINYAGYIEADAIFNGEIDVVVCDGFVGNVALKSSEGVARLLIAAIKRAFNRNWLTRLVALSAITVLREVRRDLDPNRRNGASLLGLQGIVIKSHGSANAMAFGHAIDEAIRQIDKNIPEKIHQQVGIMLKEVSQHPSDKTLK